MKKVTIYVLRDTATGLYEAGEGRWTGPEGDRRWIPKATAASEDDAEQWDDEDITKQFPDGLPPGWEKVKLYDLERKNKK